VSLEEVDDSPEPSKLNLAEQAGFARGAKLTEDSFNLWHFSFWFQCKADCARLGIPFTLGKLKPVEHYEAHYRRVNPGSADELMKRSDLLAVAAFDSLADEFNEHLDEIENGGEEEAMKYVSRAIEIIYSKR